MRIGMITSSIAKLGSGEITVRAEKSTRLADKLASFIKLPRKRPVLPFSLDINDRTSFFNLFNGSPGVLEFIYYVYKLYSMYH
jgi:hypothetical protein